MKRITPLTFRLMAAYLVFAFLAILTGDMFWRVPTAALTLVVGWRLILVD